ncbi:hypothetical protein BGZ98_003632, partial [Dissophora globulifera]
MAHLTPASILASINNGCNNGPDMMNYHHHHDGMSPFEDSDSDSSHSGSSSSSFSLHGAGDGAGVAMHNGQPITYHYFCNFPT